MLPMKAAAQFGGPAFETNPALTLTNPITATNLTGLNIKDLGADSIAWFIVNTVLERMAASVVDWINSGFNGKPAFLTNPEAYYKNIADGVAGEIIYNHPNFKWMCSPFKVQVQIALQKSYMQPYQFQCTLGDIANNWENFMDDFSAGGWDGFLQLTQTSTNNPVGLYLDWQSQLDSTKEQQKQLKQKELDQGRGFLSFESCDEQGVPVKRTVVESGHFELQPDGTNKFVPGKTKEIEEKQCKKSSTKTPGSVIEGQLNNVLGVGQGRLTQADEINEIISALLNQLMNKALGGLSGLVKGKPGNGNESNYLNQLENATEKDLNLVTIPTRVTPSTNWKCPPDCQCPTKYPYILEHNTDPEEYVCVLKECPDGYTEDKINNRCVSTEKIQTSLTNQTNEIENSKKPTDTSKFGNLGTPGSGEETGGRNPPPPPPAGSVPSNPACGPAAKIYPAAATGLEGDLCGMNAMLIGGPTGNFRTGGFQWTCAYLLTNTYASCSGTRE